MVEGRPGNEADRAGSPARPGELVDTWEDKQNNVWKVGSTLWMGWPDAPQRQLRVCLGFFVEPLRCVGFFVRVDDEDEDPALHPNKNDTPLMDVVLTKDVTKVSQFNKNKKQEKCRLRGLVTFGPTWQVRITWRSWRPGIG